MNLLLRSISPVVRNIRYNNIQSLACSYVDPEYVFVYIKEGKGIYVIDGLEYNVEAGDLVLLPPYKQHIVCSRPEHQMDECVIHFDLFISSPSEKSAGMNFEDFIANANDPESLLANVAIFRKHVPSSVQAQIFNRYEFMRREHDSDNPADIRILRERAALLDILTLYLLQPETCESSNKKKTCNWKNVEAAIAYIHQNFHHPITLEQISRKAGMSKNYFCTLFREYTGTTIHNYLNQLRLEKACRIMKDTSLSLTEIAELTGSGSIHAFSKLFKKHFKISPSEYRSQFSTGRRSQKNKIQI